MQGRIYNDINDGNINDDSEYNNDFHGNNDSDNTQRTKNDIYKEIYKKRYNSNSQDNNINIGGYNKLSIDMKNQMNVKNKFEEYINNKYNNTMFKNKNKYKRKTNSNVYLDSIDNSNSENKRIILGSAPGAGSIPGFGSQIHGRSGSMPGRIPGFKPGSGSQMYGRTRQLGMICARHIDVVLNSIYGDG